MKKKLVLLLIVIVALSTLPSFAINIGTYKTETEYGLLDGFKINWKRKDKTQPFIQPREESLQFEKEKELKDYKETEYERTRFMYEGRSII